MTKLGGFLFVLGLGAGALFAKCTNPVHEKALLGTADKKVYECPIKSSNSGAFKVQDKSASDWVCKKCGCSRNDHNDD